MGAAGEFEGLTVKDARKAVKAKLEEVDGTRRGPHTMNSLAANVPAHCRAVPVHSGSSP